MRTLRDGQCSRTRSALWTSSLGAHLVLLSKGHTQTEFGQASSVTGHRSTASLWGLRMGWTATSTPTGNGAPVCEHTYTHAPRHKDVSTLSLWITGLGFGEKKEEREELLGNQPGVAMAFPRAAGPIRAECGLLSVSAGRGCKAGSAHRAAECRLRADGDSAPHEYSLG